RGVLVIPTEELEALRRPLPPVPPAPPVAPTPPTQPGDGGGGRRAPLLIGLVMLLAIAATGGAIFYLSGPGVAARPTPTPQASLSTPPSASATPSQEPSPTPQASQTPFPETPKPDPTPRPDDTFKGYEVTVLQGENTLFEVDADGNILRSETAHFDRFSQAPVDRIEASNGLLHWRTSDGFFTGLSYIRDRSGAFLIREVYEGSDGQKRYFVLDQEDT
ncbi:MAG: hypothetical protein WD402_07225, partial [Chloroflexota bacterium]